MARQRRRRHGQMLCWRMAAATAGSCVCDDHQRFRSSVESIAGHHSTAWRAAGSPTRPSTASTPVPPSPPPRTSLRPRPSRSARRGGRHRQRPPPLLLPPPPPLLLPPPGAHCLDRLRSPRALMMAAMALQLRQQRWLPLLPLLLRLWPQSEAGPDSKTMAAVPAAAAAALTAAPATAAAAAAMAAEGAAAA